MNESKENFANKIKESWESYWNFKGCEYCNGNGCDDCRDCEQNSYKSNLYKKARNLEEGFKNIYGITYKEFKDMNYTEYSIKSDNFFDANDARSRSTHVVSGYMEEELNFIYDAINKAINNGKYECNFSDKNFSKQSEDFLKEKGFTINHFYGDQRDPCNETTISWK